MSYGVIILAAGQGKRMQSTLPKVLHNCAGQPMLCRVLLTALNLPNVTKIVIVAGEAIEQLQIACEKAIIEAFPTDLHTKDRKISTEKIIWAFQQKPIGTANAVDIGLSKLIDDLSIKNILVLYGDVPLISVETLNKFINNTKQQSIGLITAIVTEPKGFGRIVRDKHNNFLSIVEDRDANNLEQQIKEINAGIYIFPKDVLIKFLPKIRNQNSQQEYYLPDLFKEALDQKILVHIETISYDQLLEVMTVNTRLQLIELERAFQLQQAINFLTQGVTIIDPKRFDLRGNAKISKDVEIDVNVILVGNIIIGVGTKIGANCYIKNSVIGANVIIEPNSVIDGATINDNTIIGPFARIRPDTIIKSGAKIGNFVELKATVVNNDSKINHLSYIGDAKIGANVNIGAGTITCNYDGVNKHITIIEDGSFIGSSCQLIAPITVHKQAFIASGTTLIKDAPSGMLTLNKKDQQSKKWQRPSKKKSTEKEQIP